MSADVPETRPLVLMAACDRHNLGDLLLPHIAARLLGDGREVHVAGLAERDLRACGGHRVRAIARLVGELSARRPVLVHAGGEVLTCTGWQAAVMLQPRDGLEAMLAYLEHHPTERAAWVRGIVGPAPLPYAMAPAPRGGWSAVAYAGVGGFDLGRLPATARDDLVGALREASFVGLRDERTQAHLRLAGVPAVTMPDPAALVAEVCAAEITAAARHPEIAALRARFRRGWLAVQVSAEFGDDASLDTLARGLAGVARSLAAGLALFRAGDAPWHDDPAVTRRLAARLPREGTAIVETVELWRLCALLAGSRGYLGSSLHGRIVAAAFGRPVLGLRSPAARGPVDKPTAYAQTWEPPGLPHVVAIDEVEAAAARVWTQDSAALARLAARQAARVRAGFDALAAATGLAPASRPA